MSTHGDDEDDYLQRLWLLRRLLTPPNPSLTYIQHIARSTSLAETLTHSALLTYVPAFKTGYVVDLDSERRPLDSAVLPA